MILCNNTLLGVRWMGKVGGLGRDARGPNKSNLFNTGGSFIDTRTQ